MKVLHVVPSYIPAYRYGGPVKAVHELCRALARKGLDITVFTTNIDREGRLNVSLNKGIDIEGVKVFYYPITFMRQYCYSRKLALALKRHIREFDIIHIHSVYLYPTFIAAYWCRKLNLPYIINPFGALDPSMITLKSRVKKTLYIKLVERRNIKKAAAVHLSSEYEKEKFLSLGFDTPVFIVPRGLELKEYERAENPEDLKKRYSELKEKKVILSMGRIHAKKRFDLLAHAFKKILQNRNDVHLVVAGTGQRAYTDKVKKLFKKLHLTKHVLFTGMLLGSEKLSALYSSDVFVLPSYGENFGIAVLEAMACNLPVVITNRVGLYPDVEEYGAGVVTECDSDKIAEAILKLLDDEALRKSMSQNGRRLVKARFTLDKVSDRMINVYKEILEK